MFLQLEESDIERIALRSAELAAEIVLKRTHEPSLMTKRECAEYLRVSVSSVDRYIKEGLPCRKVGGQPRFVKDDVDEWLT